MNVLKVCSMSRLISAEAGSGDEVGSNLILPYYTEYITFSGLTNQNKKTSLRQITINERLLIFPPTSLTGV